MSTSFRTEKFYDSVDNVTPSASEPAGPGRVVHVFARPPAASSSEDRRPVGRLDSAVQIHSPRLRLIQFLGQSPTVQHIARSSFRCPVQIGQQVDDINHYSHSTFLQALHWSVEATCMLDKGLSALGLILSQSKSTIVASQPIILCAVRRELQMQGSSNENANVGLDATAGQRRSVKTQRKRERKCRKRIVHIKIIQNGLKHKHESKRLFKTEFLPALA